jgi:hypothetical protein
MTDLEVHVADVDRGTESATTYAPDSSASKKQTAKAIAVLQLLYTETTPQSGFFLKKKPPSIESVRTYVLENRSRSGLDGQ